MEAQTSLEFTEDTVSAGITFDEGVVVQLVRIHACHAWGREFESRPHRQQNDEEQLLFIVLYYIYSFSGLC